MPKKSAAARGGAQRNKPKVQKNIELVRPTPTTIPVEQALETGGPDEIDGADESNETDGADKTNEIDNDAEQTVVATSVETMIAPKAKSANTTRRRSTTAPKVGETSARAATSVVKREEQEKEAEEQEKSEVATAAPKSAAARLAARRQSGQKNQQRSAPTLITAEHYSYVRKDLIFIAVLAAIMFGAIIILHFVPGIGS